MKTFLKKPWFAGGVIGLLFPTLTSLLLFVPSVPEIYKDIWIMIDFPIFFAAAAWATGGGWEHSDWQLRLVLPLVWVVAFGMYFILGAGIALLFQRLRRK